jgi:hypothetical protein
VPETLGFPICDADGAEDCEALAAARNRALQYGHRDVAVKAVDLARAAGCAWAQRLAAGAISGGSAKRSAKRSGKRSAKRSAKRPAKHYVKRTPTRPAKRSAKRSAKRATKRTPTRSAKRAAM